MGQAMDRLPGPIRALWLDAGLQVHLALPLEAGRVGADGTMIAFRFDTTGNLLPVPSWTMPESAARPWLTLALQGR
jgi:hypothetical protein